MYSLNYVCCPLLAPARIAVVAAAPAGRSEPLQSSDFGHQAEFGVVGLLAELRSGFGLPAELTQDLRENNTRV